jgi:prolipoprotein diacylglyceryltransferase
VIPDPVLPVLVTIGGVPVRSYAVAVLAAFAVGAWLRAREVARLGYGSRPGHAWVGTGALIGGVLGSKLGLVWFGPLTLTEAGRALLDLDLTGKTVYGGLLGGWAGVEVAKRLAGVTGSTGDAFVAPVLAGQAIGRLGCFLNGCCAGVDGLPVPLGEAALDLSLLVALRRVRSPEGAAFRWMVAGYSGIRFVLDPWRADARWMWGPLSALQWTCLLVAVTLSVRLLRPSLGSARAR